MTDDYHLNFVKIFMYKNEAENGAEKEILHVICIKIGKSLMGPTLDFLIPKYMLMTNL